MRLSIVGSGYVGTVTGVGFAELGNEVHFVDMDEAKVQALNAARSPIFEPTLSFTERTCAKKGFFPRFDAEKGGYRGNTTEGTY